MDEPLGIRSFLPDRIVGGLALVLSVAFGILWLWSAQSLDALLPRGTSRPAFYPSALGYLGMLLQLATEGFVAVGIFRGRRWLSRSPC